MNRLGEMSMVLFAIFGIILLCNWVQKYHPEWSGIGGLLIIGIIILGAVGLLGGGARAAGGRRG